MVEPIDTNSVSTLHPAFAGALSCVCQATNWDYGEAWMLNPEETLLELSPIWYIHPNRDDDRRDALEKFGVCSRSFVLSINEGLPGRVFQLRQPQWIEDVSVPSEGYFLRNQLARAFNLKAGFGFPVFRHQSIIAIFVFFTDRACEEDKDLIQLAIAAATL